MSNPRVSKRQRERDRQDRAKLKAQRRVERMAADAEQASEATPASQQEIVDELAGLHARFAAGEVSPEDFETERSELALRLRVD